MSLKIHWFQHIAYEDLGCIEPWCKQKGHSVSLTKFYDHPVIPDISEIDWLIVMGGPMNIYDNDKYPWLAQEMSFILKAIKSGKTVLGICLGSQLIASALGSTVYKNPEKEIGWFDVMLTEKGISSTLLKDMQTATRVFHWHGDTFDLPEETNHLAFSAACRNQIFLAREKVMGIQCHFEISVQGVIRMIENGRNEIVPGNYVQSENEILAAMDHVEQNNRIMYSILDRLAADKDLSEKTS
jgi:GMP synthase-like glutamine amidotransferase